MLAAWPSAAFFPNWTGKRQVFSRIASVFYATSPKRKSFMLPLLRISYKKFCTTQTLTSAVLHVPILYLFETNTYEYVLEVFVRICVRIFAYVIVRINVRTPRRIFVRTWTYTVRICTYPGPYLHVSRFVSASILLRRCGNV